MVYWNPLLWSGAVIVIPVWWTHETENSQWDTQQYSAACSETNLTLTFGFCVIQGSSLPWWGPEGHLPGCWRASLSICIDSTPFPPSLHEEKILDLWWKILKYQTVIESYFLIFFVLCSVELTDVIESYFFIFYFFVLCCVEWTDVNGFFVFSFLFCIQHLWCG